METTKFLTACYDLQYSPPTYDFVGFLLTAERERIDRGLDGLRIWTLPGPAGGFRKDNLAPYTVAEREAMRDRIVVLMARLLPSVSTVEVRPDRSEPDGPQIGHGQKLYGTDVFVKRFGEGLFPLRAPDPVKRKDYVTITLREADYWPERNSNLLEWLKIAEWCFAQGLDPVFVRDTREANGPLAYETCPEASVDLTARANLYAGARLNLFVNNGPAWVCFAMGVPIMIAKMVTESCGSTTSRFWASCGLPPGEQMKGAGPHQRVFWGEDVASEMIPAIRAML